jgi:uncharacterized membrane protein YecN with MAPEG domain
MLTKLDAAAIYAGLNLLILLGLSLLVVRARIKHKVTIGDAGNPEMLRAIRAHANATEYVPAGLAGLLFFALLDPIPLWALHAAGVSLTLGRIAHGLGLSGNSGQSAGRGLGTLLTWGAFLGLGVGLVYAGLAPLL